MCLGGVPLRLPALPVNIAAPNEGRPRGITCLRTFLRLPGEFSMTVEETTNSTPPTWTDDQVDTASTMWRNSHTAAEIGNKIGKTRRAVIGKMYRLKVKHGSAVTQTEEGDDDAQPAKDGEAGDTQPGGEAQEASDAEAAEAKDAAEAIEDKRTVLMELTERSCRWPVGDPSTPNFWFCGKQTVQTGKPYCEEHSALAYHPNLSKRERRDLKTQYARNFKHRLYSSPAMFGSRSRR